MEALAMWLHYAAIVLLVGGPLVGLIAPETSAVQFILVFVVSFAALAVAEIHAGLFDDLLEMFDVSGRAFVVDYDKYLDEDVRRRLNDGDGA